MFDFHEKRKIRKVLYSRPILVVLVILILWIGVSVYERFTIEREMAQKLESRKEELEALKQRALTLESEVGHMQNDRGIEEELRSRFDVVKEGEQVVIILDDADVSKGSTTTRNTREEPVRDSFLGRMKKWLSE